MLFRVTFSDDTNEYYKEVPRDMQVSLTIEAKSFKEAELKASQHLTILLFWPTNFEIVSILCLGRSEIDKMDRTAVIEEWNDDLSGFTHEDVSVPVKKVPELWILQTGIQILDPDGWDRKDPESWYTPITREDFINRALKSTCYRWPNPLYDDVDEQEYNPDYPSTW